MRIYGDENNAYILKEIGLRMKDIRVSRNMSQQELANAAGIGIATVSRMERGDGASLENLIMVLRALDILGNINSLLPEQKQNPEERFRGETKRKRSYKRKENESSDSEWLWGDEKV